MNVRHYGKFRSPLAVPSLTDIQTISWKEFLQEDVPFNRRSDLGLEAILRETFPIYSYDKTVSLEYLGYELGRPRYIAEECRVLGVTYGMPFKVLLRLEKPEPVEEWVYLGEIPIMVGGGEFIVNGSERVIVSQLHRSPGVDFSVELHTSDKKLHSCWIIPQRGSWVELSVTKKDVLDIKIDQSSKFPATTFLRAMSEEYGTNEQILPLFYKTRKLTLKGSKDKELLGKHVVGDVVDTRTGEVLLKSGSAITAETLETLMSSSLKNVEIIENAEDDPMILYTLAEDNETRSHEEALLRIYSRLRPGNPPNIEKARTLFRERFQDSTRYRLGPVGRFRINRKFRREAKGEGDMTLTAQDIVDAIAYIMELRSIGRMFVGGLLLLTFVLSLVATKSIFRLGIWTFTGFAALFPLAVAALYWKRSTKVGAFASVMTVAGLWTWFFVMSGDRPGYTLGNTGIMPVAVILLASTAAMIAGSLLSRPPSAATIARFFPEPKR